MGSIHEDLHMSKPFRSNEEELYLLLKRVHFFMMVRNEDLLKVHGLTEITYNIMRILRGAGADGLPCSEISRRMLSRVPDVTRLIDRLVELDFVTRGRNDEGDRRVVIQKLTSTGDQVINSIDAPIDELHRDHFKVFSEEEKVQLIGLLSKLHENPNLREKKR